MQNPVDYLAIWRSYSESNAQTLQNNQPSPTSFTQPLSSVHSLIIHMHITHSHNLGRSNHKNQSSKILLAATRQNAVFFGTIYFIQLEHPTPLSPTD
jgi:hypothetical protein